MNDPTDTAQDAPPLRLLDRIRPAFASSMSQPTEEAYVDRVKRFVLFHGKQHRRMLGTATSEHSLHISPSTDMSWPRRTIATPVSSDVLRHAFATRRWGTVSAARGRGRVKTVIDTPVLTLRGRGGHKPLDALRLTRGLIRALRNWIPAFAGMTGGEMGMRRTVANGCDTTPPTISQA